MHLLSPVFGKELMTLARRKRHYFVRALFLACMLSTIWMAWREATGHRMYRSGFTDLSHVGHMLFESFTVTQLVAVILLMPALTAPVIADEKDRDTLGLLLMSNLNTYNILLDKLVSRILLVILLLLSCLPVFLALMAFGGVSFNDITFAYMEIFSTILFCCGFGLLVSTRSAKTHSALVGTYVALTCYVLSVVLLCLLALLWGTLFNSYGASDMMETIPLMFLPVIGFTGVDSWVFTQYWHTVFFFPAISILIFSYALWKCATILPSVAMSTGPSYLRRQFDRLNRFFQRINFTGVTVMRDDAVLGRYPLLWRETRKRFCCSRIFLLRTGCAVVAVTLVFSLPWADDEYFACMLSSLHLIILATITIVLSATAFTSEKEKHELDIMLCTPVRSRELVISKFLGVLRSVSVVAVVPLIMPMINLVPAWRSQGWEWERGLALLVLTVLAWLPVIILIGLYFGAKCRRGGTAMVYTFLAVLAWCTVPVLFYIVGVHYVDAWSPADVWVACLGPVGWVYSVFFEQRPVMIIWLAVSVSVLWVRLLVCFIRRFDAIIGRQ